MEKKDQTEPKCDNASRLSFTSERITNKTPMQ